MDKPSHNPNENAEATPENGELVLGDPVNAAASELSEDQALAMLRRTDVTASSLAQLARNPRVMNSRKVLLALATHHRTPRHITIPLLRRLFTFDLMQVVLAPTVAADVKRAAEEQILNRLESLSSGERISLARRGSGRVAAALLLDTESRVTSTALDNSRLVEAHCHSRAAIFAKSWSASRRCAVTEITPSTVCSVPPTTTAASLSRTRL